MEYSVSVNSYELVSIVGEPIVHNEIVLTFPSGEGSETNSIYLNGQSFDRQSGEFTDLSLTNPNDTLRVVGSAKSIGEEYGDDVELAYSQVIWSGDDGKEFGAILIRAVEASVFMNSQSMDYIPAAVLHESQNSNSVAATLVHATGLTYSSDQTYPPETESLWAPGGDRILLPKTPIPSALTLDNDLVISSSAFSVYLNESMETLSMTGIAGQIKDVEDADYIKSSPIGHPSSRHHGHNRSEGREYFDPENAKPMIVDITAVSEDVSGNVEQPSIVSESNQNTMAF